MEIAFCPKCSVCLKEFSDELSPRNLKCGHSVCSICLGQIIQFDKSCPECRQSFEAVSINDLPLNHPVLRISRILSFAKIENEKIQPIKLISDQPIREPLRSAGICSEHGHNLFFICMRCITWVCRGCLALNHPDPPSGRCSIASIQEGIDKIKSMHQKVLESYLKEAKETEVKLKEFVRGFTDVLEYCKNNKSGSEQISCEKRMLEIDELKQETQHQLSELENQTGTLSRVGGILEEITDLEGFITAHEECLKYEYAFDKFMIKQRDRKVQQYIRLFLPHQMELVELLKTGTPVYGIQEKDGNCRWSEVVYEDNKVLLYSLRDGKPPKEGVCLPFELLRVGVPAMSPRVFMDFGGDGEFKGRSCIQMFGDTARGRQAVLLCSGERGPSYRNTTFYETYFHEDEDACLKGGDYENDDGTGGHAIVDDITDDDIYKMEIKTGMMVGWPADEHYRLGSFRLYTFDYDWIIAEHAFGIVTENLDEVVEGIGREDDCYEEPKVLDCGLVLSL